MALTKFIDVLKESFFDWLKEALFMKWANIYGYINNPKKLTLIEDKIYKKNFRKKMGNYTS